MKGTHTIKDKVVSTIVSQYYIDQEEIKDSSHLGGDLHLNILSIGELQGLLEKDFAMHFIRPFEESTTVQEITRMVAVFKDVEARIREVLSLKSGVGKNAIYLYSLIERDLGFDSMDMIELIMSIEDEFSLELPEEDESIDLPVIRVSDMIDMVLKHLSCQS